MAVTMLACMLSLAVDATSVAERSPFAQGLWWDPARSGHGFEIWNTADRVAVIWFTYDNAGRPVWYSSTGALDSLGKQAWPLLRHQWNAGAPGPATTIGTLRLNPRHAEAADVEWDIGGQRGAWTIQPLIVSGVVNEVDHSGVWFDPSNSGWGLSLTEQGDFVGGVLYAYEPSGAPTWAGAFARGVNANVEYRSYRGTCPGCPYTAPTSSPAGTLLLARQSETRAIVQNRLTLPLAAGVNVDGARIVQLGRPVSSRPADRQLASFDDEGALRTYLAAGMQNLPSSTPPGWQFSPPPATPAFSPTNLQESGVDEGDLVKSNGVQLYTYGHDHDGARLPVVRIAEVFDEGAALTVRGSVTLQGSLGATMATAGLFLHGSALVSVNGTRPLVLGASGWPHPGGWLRGTTHVEILDASVPARPVTRWRVEFDGHVVASRRIGDRLYVVSRFVPFVQGFSYGATFQAAVESNQRLLAGLPLVDMLPKMKVNGGAATPMVAPGAIHVPPQGSRKPMADMLVVTAIDLTEARIAQTLAIVGTAETAYASSTSLVVASSRYELRTSSGLLLPEPPVVLTDLHQIRLGTAGMSIAGSASIEGMLTGDADKAAFRLSEHQGRVRAVTTSSTMWGGSSRNRLTILEPSTIAQGVLKTVSFLPNERRPQTLGKPNEDLYGTRFVGDRLYAVTFRRIDPLYVVDLTDSADPRITGELEVTGFSDYLHPLPNGLLLGFGKDAQPANVVGDGQWAWFQGLQLTLFDVADPNRPRELQRVVLGKRGSESALLRSHHAFSTLMQADGQGRLAFPARIHDGAPYTADVWSGYPWQYSGLMRFELRGTGAADARLVPLPSLVTHNVVAASPVSDAAATEARAVQFRNGTIYIGSGRFWRQDAAGGTVGPL
jgi:hypothetical protein